MYSIRINIFAIKVLHLSVAYEFRSFLLSVIVFNKEHSISNGIFGHDIGIIFDSCIFITVIAARFGDTHCSTIHNANHAECLFLSGDVVLTAVDVGLYNYST